MAKETATALHWIVDLLRKHKIAFRISGGLAANVYGSKRPLFDIDIDLPDVQLLALAPKVKKYVIFGPARFKDGYWDLLLMILHYKGQRIDLSGADSEKIFDRARKRWVKCRIDLASAERRTVFGKIVPLIPLKKLIAYKKKLARRTDLLDVKELQEKRCQTVEIKIN